MQRFDEGVEANRTQILTVDIRRDATSDFRNGAVD